MSTEKPPPRSSFGERFGFARWWQELARGAENDAEFAREIDRSSTQIGDYRKAEHTPNSGALPDAAARLGVDYEWLTGKRPAPPDTWPDARLFMDLFRRWLEKNRRPLSVPGRPATVRVEAEPEPIAKAATPKKSRAQKRAR